MQQFLFMIQKVLGNNSFFFFLVIVLGLLAIPQVSAIDQRWRGALLTLGRVPKDAINLKQHLLECMNTAEFSKGRIDAMIEKVQQPGNDQYWRDSFAASKKNDPNAALARALLKSLCILSLNKTHFEISHLEMQDLSKIESRLKEIAAVVPTFTYESKPVDHQNYRKEVTRIQDQLLEILAKKFVKTYPDVERRHAAIVQQGFKIGYIDKKSLDIAVPAFISISGVLACCALSVIIFLPIFDAFNVSLSQQTGDPWFTINRILRWSLGAWISYSIATAFGLFFEEVLKKKVNHKSIATYLLAFVFAALGSCIFFLISRSSFRPGHVWLAISFGLISAVAIQSRNRDFIHRQEMLRYALQLSLIYAFLSALLQVAVFASFRGWHNIPFLHMSLFFFFGFVRGGAVAFTISLVFMECAQVSKWSTRRKSPRLLFRKHVEGSISGQKAEIYLKDLSDRGASMRFDDSANPEKGDEVALKLGFANITGKVYWASRNLARIKFDPNDPALMNINEVIGQNMGAGV